LDSPWVRPLTYQQQESAYILRLLVNARTGVGLQFNLQAFLPIQRALNKVAKDYSAMPNKNKGRIRLTAQGHKTSRNESNPGNGIGDLLRA
jgi:hypothetical protein